MPLPHFPLDSALVCQAYMFRHEFPELAKLTGVEHLSGGNIVWPTQILMAWTGQSEDACAQACEDAAAAGLIDYGVSVRGGWLDDAGKELLASTRSTLDECLAVVFEEKTPFDLIASFSPEAKERLTQELDRIEADFEADFEAKCEAQLEAKFEDHLESSIPAPSPSLR